MTKKSRSGLIGEIIIGWTTFAMFIFALCCFIFVAALKQLLGISND